MITLIFGLILLAVPFLLIDLFSNKKTGFIYVLFFLLLFQTALALLTQVLGIFYYGVVAGCMIVANIILIFVYLKIRSKNKKNFVFNLKNIDWVVIIVAVISILSLYQVHYNYTGEISSAPDTTASYHQVKNMVYPYPYFSDEWYAVSLVQGAISNHSLPVKNLLNNGFFPDLELFFHSFVAQVSLLLGLNVLTQYTILLIFFNALIIILIYLFLRINNISKLTAGVCSLLALYISCGADLPGLWQFIPFNMGVIFFLLSLCLMEMGDLKTVFLSVILASFFYPPLIPFYFAGLAVFLFQKINAPKEKLFRIVSYGFLSIFFAVPIIVLLLMASPLAHVTNYVFSRIFFIAFTAPFSPQFYFYYIIPIPAILLAIFGMYYIYSRKKWVLLAELVFGIIFWIFYSFSLSRFFAEYERIVILTSIIVVIISGFGLQRLQEYIKYRFEKYGEKIIKIAEVLALFVFLILILFYTQGQNWKKFILTYPALGATAYPKAPANNYLTADDLRIFKDIKDKRFLSLPWKGTVIGVAAGNYPVLTKEGTISLGSGDMLNNFSKADCAGKYSMAKKLKLDYIYIYEFNCPGFEKEDKSSENLVLYKVKND